MDYIEITVPCLDPEEGEIIMASLSDYPFEGFETSDISLKAFIRADQMEAHRADIMAVLRSTGMHCTFTTIEQRNWNAEWESGFEPVRAGGIMIRAPFHEPPGDDVMDIVIMPKMSFGTGHHPTTRLIAELMTGYEFQGRQVLDMGSGTGVLSVIAARLGAAHADAVDIDEWAWENCTENTAANGVSERIQPILGDVTAVEGRTYDIILANINRNILCRDMEAYSKMLTEGGLLLLSGILEDDLAVIDRSAAGAGLARERVISEEGWSAASYVKATAAFN